MTAGVASAARGLVPHAVTDPGFIPRERYTAPGFFALEREWLWPRVWQMACRLEEIPEVGDFVEYTICDQSVLVVRQADASVKAFFNVCRHRATQLAVGRGCLPDREIACPFHGWRWDIDGTNSYVYGRAGFDESHLTASDLALRECRVGVWGGCAFVNMDPDAPPLEDVLAPIGTLLDPLGVDRMRVRWWKSVLLDANWKLAQEAFMEGLHVMQTHPQLTLGAGASYDPDDQAYFVHANGHSHFQNTGGRPRSAEPGPAERSDKSGGSVLERIIESSRLLWEGLDAMTLERDYRVIEGLRERPVAGSPGAALVRAIYEHAAEAGIPMPAPDPAAIGRWGGMFFLFPNYFVLPQYGNALVYRSRPHGLDAERCLFELWSISLFPEGEEPARPEPLGPFRPDDTEAWPPIPLQDFSNIERQQRGLHSRACRGMRLSGRYEGGIANMHQELDRYLVAAHT